MPKRRHLRRRHQLVYVPVSAHLHRRILPDGCGRVLAEAVGVRQRSHLHEPDRRFLLHLRERVDGRRLLGEHRRLRGRLLLQRGHVRGPRRQLLLQMRSREDR